VADQSLGSGKDCAFGSVGALDIAGFHVIGMGSPEKMLHVAEEVCLPVAHRQVVLFARLFLLELPQRLIRCLNRHVNRMMGDVGEERPVSVIFHEFACRLGNLEDRLGVLRLLEVTVGSKSDIESLSDRRRPVGIVFVVKMPFAELSGCIPGGFQGFSKRDVLASQPFGRPLK